MTTMDVARTNSAAGSGESRQIVTFNVDDRVFGIDVGVVREIKGWQEATPLPHAAPYVRGRGQPARPDPRGL